VQKEAHTVKSYRKVIEVNIPARMAFLNITPQVNAALRESGIREGLTLVNAMHITASVFINDDEPGLHEDYALFPTGKFPLVREGILLGLGLLEQVSPECSG